MHIDYEQIEGKVEVDNPTVVGLLNTNASSAEKKQAATAGKKALFEELGYELREFTLAAAQFSSFLKRYSIMPYNDATLDYLERSIGDEREKVEVGGSRDKLEQLVQYRKQYEQEAKILNDQMAKGENSKLLEQPGWRR